MAEGDEFEMHGEQNKTEFNAGIATLYRCDSVKKHMGAYLIAGDYQNYVNHLILFFLELAPIMPNEKKEKKKQGEEDIVVQEYHEKKWVEARTIRNKYTEEAGYRVSEEEKQMLELWDLELRAAEQQMGMNMPKNKDQRFALAR